jgi:tetratricopeptide (TPR) repeat protein
VILVVVGLVYARALFNGYTYDDRQYVAAYTMRGPNLMVLEDQDLIEYFNRPMGYGVQETARGFRPLTVLSYALTHRITRSGIQPPRVHPDYPENGIIQKWTDPAWPHHLINLLLHLLATWIVYMLVRRFTGPGLPALAAAAVFGLHALRSDQVISIVGRGELLPFVFGGGATLLYLAAMERSGRSAWLRLGAVLAFMMVAFLSKESSIAWVLMTPLVAATLHVKNGGALRESVRRQWLPWVIAVVLPALIFFALRARMMALAPEAQQFAVGSDNNQLFALSLFERLPTAVMVWGYGLWKVFVPYPLSCDYGRNVFEVVGYLDWRFGLAAVALIALLVVGLLCMRRLPLLFLGVAAFLGFGFITSNIPIPIETIFGERLYYTPTLLLSFVAACLVGRGGRTVLLGGVVWLVASAGVCVLRTVEWTSNETLFAADAETRPRSMGLQMNMARVSRLREEWDRREHFLQRALAIDPDYYLAQNELALDLVAERRHAEALPKFLHAVRILEKQPFEYQNSGPDVLVNLANLQQRLGKFDDAAESYARVIAVASKRRSKSRAARDAHLGLMWLAWRRQDTAAIGGVLKQMEAQFPGDPEAKIYRGVLMFAAKDAPAAVDKLSPLLDRLPASIHTILGCEVISAALRQTGAADKAMTYVMRRAALLHSHGLDKEALVAFADAVGDPRHTLAAYKGMLWSTWETGGAWDIDALLKKALPLAPNDGQLAAHTGLLAFAAREFKTAATILSKVAPRLGPSRDALRVWMTLGETLLRLGDRGNARAVADRFSSTRGIPPDYKKRFKNLKARVDASTSK